MKSFLNYLRLFYPPAFRRSLKRLAQNSYYAGWDQGYNRGHQRGFEALRSQTKNGGRYRYVKPAGTERPELVEKK
jgi:hypothetical protein